ncbi:MAG TPA: phosphoenolpyruvate--protein phosphotransferase [Treponemataceae bacterium]|nr:phosphoenolpyruvate--protein phosphotransferase [Treponemataceae bacterium]
MKKLEGLSASRGIVIGTVFCLADEIPVAIPRVKIDASEADAQWARFESALAKSRGEVSLLKDDRNKEQSEILEAHLMMLSDPDFIPKVRDTLFSNLVNVESALKTRVDEAAGMLRATGDAYLAERAVDIEDAFGRVMGHLLEDSPGSAQGSRATRFVPPGAILAAKNIRPSDALSLKDSGIAGIVLEEGGATSHVAILARAWRIPAVMGVRGLFDAVSDGDGIILDANDGLVIQDPTNEQLSSYRTKQRTAIRSQAETSLERSQLAIARAETTDGAVMSLRANIASADEALSAREEGADGVGLFRSEFLFLGQGKNPDEETQFLAYRAAVENMCGAPVVIRTLDAGADKMLDEQSDLAEKNPLLGWRAVRFCLDRRDLFKTQLRALLRASQFGDLRIMFPMISNIEELEAVLDVLEESKAECAHAGQPFNKAVKAGIMIEIPAAAVCADILAQKADFMSIGTNDLIQYTMAVDRENPKVSHLFDCYNPSVLRLVKRTIDAGKETRTEVSMCGEMAGDPASVFLLMGLGLRTFSMASTLIPQVKELVRKVSLAEATELAEAALELSSAREIRKLVQERIKTYE